MQQYFKLTPCCNAHLEVMRENRIPWIKIFRNVLGCGLLEAKNHFDRFLSAGYTMIYPSDFYQQRNDGQGGFKKESFDNFRSLFNEEQAKNDYAAGGNINIDAQVGKDEDVPCDTKDTEQDGDTKEELDKEITENLKKVAKVMIDRDQTAHARKVLELLDTYIQDTSVPF